MYWSPASGRAVITGVSPHKTPGEEDSLRRGGAGPQPGDHPEAAGRAAQAGTAQDQGSARVHPRCARPVTRGQGGDGHQRRVDRIRPQARGRRILSGISARPPPLAVRLAKLPEFAGKTIVTILTTRESATLRPFFSRDGSNGRRHDDLMLRHFLPTYRVTMRS